MLLNATLEGRLFPHMPLVTEIIGATPRGQFMHPAYSTAETRLHFCMSLPVFPALIPGQPGIWNCGRD